MNVAKLLNKRILISFSIVLALFVLILIGIGFFVGQKFNTSLQKEKDLEFVFMESSSLSLGEAQNVYVSCYDADYANNLSLTYHKLGQEKETIYPSEVVDEVALFSIPFENDYQVGKYLLDCVSWSTKDAGNQILENEKGYSFEVDNIPIGNEELPAGIFDISGNGEISESNLLSPEKTQMLFTGEANNTDLASNGLKVCLDPGHGGSDPGACYGRLQEKWVNLNIADACKERLQSYGIQVVMTRDSDVAVDLQQRCEIARNNGCNLFVSFHNNSGGAVGSEVWVQYDGCSWHDEFAYIGSDIARLILENLHTHFGLTNRGAKDRIWDGRSYPGGSPGDYYAVLYYSRLYEIPGLLIEHAFMDGDYNFLCDNNNLIQMGYQDAEAIAKYYGMEKPRPYIKEMKESSLTFEWNNIEKATKYAVYRFDGTDYIPYTEDYHSNSFTATGLTIGEQYEFLVQAFVNGRWTSFTKTDHLVARLLPVPNPINVSYPDDGVVEFSWNKLPNASKYAVAEYINGKFVTYSTEVTSESSVVKYSKNNLSCDVEHKFLIQAWFCDKWWSWYDMNCLVSCTPEGPTKPESVVINQSYNSVNLSWSQVPGAINYDVAVKKVGDKDYVNHFTNNTLTTYQLTGMEPSTPYVLVVQACNFLGSWSPIATEDLHEFTMLDDPSRPKVFATSGNGTVTLEWAPIPDAEKYAIYKLVGKDFIPFSENFVNNIYQVTNLPNNIEYTFLVQAFSKGKWSKYNSYNLVKCTPEGPVKPLNITGVPGSKSIKVSWDKVPGATSYAIAIQTSPLHYYTYTKDCKNTFYTVNGLMEGKEYKVLVQCLLNGRWSTFSEPEDLAVFETLDTRPIPSATWTQGDDGIVKLSWPAIPNAEKYAVYEVVSTGKYRALNENVTDIFYSADDLANGYFHEFLVQAFVADSWSTITPSLFAKAKPEGNIKPFNVAAVPGSRSVKLSWSHVPGVTCYAIAKRTASGEYITYTYNCYKEEYIVSGLEEGTTYTFLIQAFINNKWSKYNEEEDLISCLTVDTKPKPSAYWQEGDDGAVHITWDAIPNADKYAIYESIGNSKYKAINENYKENSIFVENLSNYYNHKFLVQSYVGGSWSKIDVSLLCNATPEGHIKPWDVVATGGYCSANISWTHVPGAEKYAIASQISLGKFQTYTTSCISNSYSIDNLIEGATYKILVQAFINGKWSSFDEAIDLVTVTTIDTRPVIDINSPLGDGSVNLQWNNIDTAEKYAVYEVVNGKYKELTTTCTTNSYLVTNLANNYSHTFLVQSYVAGFWSKFNRDNFATFTPTGTIKPKDPGYTSDDVNHVVISWGATPGAERYAIARKMADGNFYTYSYNVTDSNYQIYLRGGETYQFLVQAFVMGKWSKYDNTDVFDVTPNDDPLRPKAHVDRVDEGFIDLSWNAIPNATKYAIATKNGDGTYTTYTYDCIDTKFSISGLLGGEYLCLVQAYINGQWSLFNDGDLVMAEVPSTLTPIMHGSRTSTQQMVNFFNASGHTYPAGYSNYGASTIYDWCLICYQEATDEGVDPAVLFCQAMHETGWLGFGGIVKWWQCNFGGIGATDSGGTPNTFNDVREGLRAQTQHLKAYGSRYGSLVHPLVDPRFHLVERGICPNVEDLGGHWASGAQYGYTIAALMRKLFTY